MKSKTTLLPKLGARGFAHHFLLPVLAVVVVAAIGVVTLRMSHAATAMAYNGPCTKIAYTLNANAACVGQAKDLLDGLQHAGWNGYKTAALPAVTGQTFAYGGQAYLDLNTSYDTATQAALKKSPFGISSLTAGTDSSDGWQMFCTTVAKSGVQNPNNANNTTPAGKSILLDFKNGNKANQTLAQIFIATCGNTSSVTKSSSTSWSLTGTVTLSTKTVKPGSTLKITGTVKNAGPAVTGGFTYGLRDFYSTTATPTRSANQPYALEFSIPSSANKSASGLKSGASVTSTGTVTIPTNPTKPFICYTEGFSPYNSAGAVNGRSTAVCVNVATSSISGGPVTSPLPVTPVAN